jgi:hypothetical protein
MARNTEPEAEPEGTEPEAADAPTTTELESKLDSFMARVEGLLTGVKPAAQDAVQERLDSPGRMAEVVQAELDRRERRAAGAAVAEKVETHAQVLAKLQETVPEAPPRRVEKIMGWGR